MDPIAIVGIGCRFPGGVHGPRSFWQMLCDGVDAIGEVPKDRWSRRSFYDAEPGKRGKTYSRWGGFLDQIDRFDPSFFSISAREAPAMDPQQRLLLEVAWEALEDAGEVLSRGKKWNAGVFIGISTQDYFQIQLSFDDKTSVDTHTTTGGAMSLAANRISYCLNLLGPSIAVDTACSSSLVAVHLACQSLWSGECAAALAGGVNTIIIPDTFIGFCNLSMLSPEGRCKTFDESADGFVRGEGAGVVVLKRLSDALAAKDPIYAIIRATGLNQDGRTGGITLPSRDAQAALLAEVYGKAGIAPSQVDYVEAHGTGTPVGDPIEASAIGTVTGRDRSDDHPCLVGSVKTNIGHLEAAAGIAGLIKAALMVKHRLIPPNLHFNKPNPRIPFGELRLRVPTSLEPWPSGSGPAVVGVNSFGFGGTNAHIVLQEAPPPEAGDAPVEQPVGEFDSPSPTPSFRHVLSRNPATRRACAGLDSGLTTAGMTHCDASPTGSEGTSHGEAFLIPLSARSAEALKSLARSMCSSLQNDGPLASASLEDIGFASSLRRVRHEHRLCLVAHSRDELVEHLEAFIADERRPGLHSGHQFAGDRPRLAFVFSGQGPQWWAMGRELLHEEPVFREMIETCDRLLGKLGKWSLLEELSADESSSRLDSTAIAQPAIFSLQVALAALWKSWGIQPDAVVGHSVGEAAAAHVSGMLSLEDAVRVMFHRGRCMDLAPERGKMLAVGLAEHEIQGLLGPYAGAVCLAAVNSPSSVTLSGDGDALDALASSLEAKNVFCKFLRVSYAFHSHQMDPVREGLMESLGGLVTMPFKVPVFSTVTGKAVEDAAFDAQYWWRNVRQPVLFAPTIDAMIQAGYTAFVEVSPHPVLSGNISECLVHCGEKGAVLPSLRRKEEERGTMLGSLGALHTLGLDVNWEKLYARGGRHVSLPTYPWQRERFWHESRESRDTRLGIEAHPLLGKEARSANPTWGRKADLSVLPYLKDHRVQGHVVFPAAAYLEMALGAARETFGPGPCVLEEVEFQRALFISPEAGTYPSLEFTLHPDDSSFQIFSRGQESDRAWTLHACGKMRPDQSAKPDHGLMVDEIINRCTQELTADVCYANFKRVGLHFGPSFQGIERLWRRDGESIGRLKVPDHLGDESGSYLIHPALLDACLQVTSGAVPGHGESPSNDLFLPVYVEQIRWYRGPGDRPWSHVRILKAGPRSLTADLRIYDADGKLSAEILGFRCQALEAARAGAGGGFDDWTYALRWQLKPRRDEDPSRRSADYLPSPVEIAASHKSSSNAMLRETDAFDDQFKGIEPDLNALCSGYILNAFGELGWKPAEGQSMATDSLMEDLAVAPPHRRLVERYLHMLAEDGIMRKSGDGWEVARLPVPMDLQGTWKSILMRFPAFYSEMGLLGRCGEHLAKVLHGEVNPLQLLFPDGSFTTIEHLYQDSPSFLAYNTIVADAVSRALAGLPGGRKARILEIGAGTGGMTSHVLAQLPPERAEYCFTDASNAFFSKCEQKFRDYPFMTYGALDIEKDPLEQGPDPHSFDIILASDVLHATSDLREALQHVHRLLASQGLLILLESNATTRFIDLIFGLTEGWWRFSDFDLRPSYPLLSPVQWRQVLEEAGFTDVAEIPEQNGGKQTNQFILAARGAHIPQVVEPDGARAPDTKASAGWLVFADDSGLAERLVQLISSRGERCVMVWEGDSYEQIAQDRYKASPSRLDQMQRLLAEALPGDESRPLGVIHLWSLNSWGTAEPTLELLEAAQSRGCCSVMHFVQAWTERNAKTTPQLWLVTRGSHSTGEETRGPAVAQSPLHGLRRVIMMEHPQYRCRLVDLSHEATETELRSLFQEIQAGEDHDGEDEIALRGHARYVHRVVRSSLFRPSRDRKHPAQIGTEAFRLEIPTPGVFDNLTLRPCLRRPPGPGEVEIQVHTTALNFRDVMKALGIYPTEDEQDLLLGDECAGRVIAVGEGVEQIRPGDEVMAIAPVSFASFVTIPAAFVVPKPSHLNFAEAVTIPITFLTAYYALHYLARIRKGERVLIHAGTGGVGMAAIQIAQAAGAEVFSTAGSPEKRELLSRLGVPHVMDSRSLSFADEVMGITGGKGVDIVLNSLAGDAIGKSFSVLGPYGRFLEIGKRDIYQNSKLGMRPFRKNLSFFAIDLSRVMEDKPAVISELMSEILQGFRDGTFHPIPFRIFGISRIANVFRHMAQAKHVGKIVVSMRDDNAMVENAAEEEVTFRDDATYMITGGLGGLGLTVADWMIEKGARHLVLVGRSAAPTERVQERLATMEGRGAKVLAASADVSLAEEVDRLMGPIEASWPPLRGIIHAAMVMDDGILLQMNPERLEKVMAPKMRGAWNLHTRTRHSPLDFFVMFSSVASTIGNAGQANYVAANAFLDAFATYRRGMGLPAATINWGHMAEVGYVARHDNVSERLNRIGLRGIPPQTAMKIMGRIIQTSPAQLVVIDIDWRQFIVSQGISSAPPMYAHLTGEDPELLGSQEGPKVRGKVLAAPPEERGALLEGYLREQVARVLATSAAKLDPKQPLTELGLDSLMAVELKNRVESDTGLSLPGVEIMKGPSIVQLTALLLAQLTDSAVSPTDKESAAPAEGPQSPEGLLVILREGGERPPLFCFHPLGGHLHPYLPFAELMDPDLPVLGIQSRALSGPGIEYSSIADMAKNYAEIILSRQPAGPYHLMGFSLGGLLALATAAALEEKGGSAALVGLIDPLLPASGAEFQNQAVMVSLISYLRSFVSRFFDDPEAAATLDDHTRVLCETVQGLPLEERLPSLMEYIRANTEVLGDNPIDLVEQHLSLAQAHLSLIGTFPSCVIHAPVYLWKARESAFTEAPDGAVDWSRYTRGEFVVEEVEADHFRIMQPPDVEAIAARVAKVLRTVQGVG